MYIVFENIFGTIKVVQKFYLVLGEIETVKHRWYFIRVFFLKFYNSLIFFIFSWKIARKCSTEFHFKSYYCDRHGLYYVIFKFQIIPTISV